MGRVLAVLDTDRLAVADRSNPVAALLINGCMLVQQVEMGALPHDDHKAGGEKQDGDQIFHSVPFQSQFLSWAIDELPARRVARRFA